MYKKILATFNKDIQKAYQEKGNPEYYKKSGKAMFVYALIPLLLGFGFRFNPDVYYGSLIFFTISAFMFCYGLYMIVANEKIAKNNKIRHTEKELNNLIKYSPVVLLVLFIFGIFTNEILKYPIFFLTITLIIFVILAFKK